MSIETGDAPDRPVTTGPDASDLSRYRYVDANGEALIYEEGRDAAWIQSSAAVDLELWR